VHFGKNKPALDLGIHRIRRSQPHNEAEIQRYSVENLNGVIDIPRTRFVYHIHADDFSTEEWKLVRSSIYFRAGDAELSLCLAVAAWLSAASLISHETTT